MDMSTSSAPSSQISPVTLARLPLCSPMMARLDTLLPEPDSPTMPSVLPRSRVKLSPFTAFTRPSSVGKCTCRSLSSKNGLPVRSAEAVVVTVSVTCRLLDGSGQPHARVDEGVQDVDDHVGEDDEDGGEQDHAHDRGQVVAEHR